MNSAISLSYDDYEEGNGYKNLMYFTIFFARNTCDLKKPIFRS